MPALVLLSLLFLTIQLSAQENLNKFKEQEVQFDIFGLGTFYRSAHGNYANGIVASMGGSDIGNQVQFSGQPGWGAGVAANVFYHRYFGVGLEQSTFGRNQGSRVATDADYYYLRWQTSGYFLVRYPLEKLKLSPYAFVGGGAQYGIHPTVEPGTPVGSPYKMRGLGFGQLGGGLEYRIAQGFGIFSDLRWLFSGVDGLPNNQMQWRYGIRLAF